MGLLFPIYGRMKNVPNHQRDKLTIKTYQHSKSTDIGEGKLEIIESNKMLSAETNQPAPCESSFSMFFTSFEHLLNMHGLPPSIVCSSIYMIGHTWPPATQPAELSVCSLGRDAPSSRPQQLPRICQGPSLEFNSEVMAKSTELPSGKLT